MSSCCCIGLTASVSGAGFGLAFLKPVHDAVEEAMKRGAANGSEYLKPEYCLALGIGAACLAVLALWVIIGLWHSRKWALWIVLILHTPGAILAFTQSKPLAGLPTIAIAIYCMLRVSGSVGPKR